VTLRAGIIGAGFMAGVHARSIRIAGGSVAGVVASSPARSSEARTTLKAARAFDTAAELIADDGIDVLHICTPNSTHAEFALAAIAHGKHIVCEKPLATILTDAQTLSEAATAAGLVAVVPFVYRFHPMARHVRERVRSGLAGEIFSVQASYLQDWMSRPEDTDWRVQSNLGGPSRAFGDIGSHLVDMIEFVLDDRIATVTARLRTVYPARSGRYTVDTEDLAAVLFETRSGTVGTLLVSQVAPGRKNALAFELSGALESLVFRQESPEELWVGRRQGSESLLRSLDLGGEVARLSAAPAGHPLGYLDAFAAFIGDTYAVIDGTARPGLPTFADGVRAASVTEAVLESARVGATVTVIESQPLTSQPSDANL